MCGAPQTVRRSQHPLGVPTPCAGTLQTVWGIAVFPEPQEPGGGPRAPLSPRGFCTKGALRDPAPLVLDSPLPLPHGPGEGESPHTLTSAFQDRKPGASIRRVHPLLAHHTSGRGGLGLPLCPTKLSEQPPPLPSPMVSKHSHSARGTTPNKGRAGGTWGDLAPPSPQGRRSGQHQAMQGRELPHPSPNFESGFK